MANAVAKYVLHGIDLYSENPWENKAVFMLYTELAIGFVKVRPEGEGIFLTLEYYTFCNHSFRLYFTLSSSAS